MEHLDILDENGNKIGLTKSKDQTHIDGDWHLAAHVWFINPKEELLIQRRSKTKINHPNMWDISVAGHVSAGEDSKTSALREIKEEIGVDLKKNDLQHLGRVIQQSVLNNGTYINNEHNDIYLVEMEININTLNFQDGEVEEAQLVPWEDFQRWVSEEKDDIVPHPEEYKLLFEYLKKHYV